jgi:hypothetical protein
VSPARFDLDGSPLEERLPLGDAPPTGGEGPAVHQHPRVGLAVPDSVGECQRLLGVVGDLVVAGRSGVEAAPRAEDQRLRQGRVVLDRAGERDRLGRERVPGRVVTTHERQDRRGGQAPDPLRIPGVGRLHRRAQPPTHLDVQPAHHPEGERGLGDVEHGQGPVGLDGPVHGRAQIVEVGGEPVQPRPRLLAGQPRPRAVGEVDVEVQVAVADAGRVVELVQPLPRVHPDRLQQPVAGLAVALADLQQGPVGQAGDQLEHRGVDPRPGHDRLRSVEPEAACEHRQPRQRELQRVAEQLVAPRDGRLEGALARQHVARPAGEQPEAVRQPGEDLRGREHPDARGRELDGEGEPVQPVADLGHRGGVPVVEPERRAHLPRPPARTGAPRPPP